MKLTNVQYGIILSGLATTLLHVSLFPDIMFILNGLGYLGLLVAYFLPNPFFQERHRLAWWVLVGYTLLTIILWIAIGNHQFIAGTTSATGYYAKVAEVILLVCLWLDRSK